MKNMPLKVAMLFLVITMSDPLFAEEWHHATAPMGQFEGGILIDKGSFGISYSCAGSFSSVKFFAKGTYVEGGESVIRVDGQAVASGNTQYNSLPDTTSFNLELKRSWAGSRRVSYNKIVDALAGGSEVVWETPTGKVFSFPLSGSSRIQNCTMK